MAWWLWLKPREVRNEWKEEWKTLRSTARAFFAEKRWERMMPRTTERSRSRHKAAPGRISCAKNIAKKEAGKRSARTAARSAPVSTLCHIRQKNCRLLFRAALRWVSVFLASVWVEFGGACATGRGSHSSLGYEPACAYPFWPAESSFIPCQADCTPFAVCFQWEQDKPQHDYTGDYLSQCTSQR